MTLYTSDKTFCTSFIRLYSTPEGASKIRRSTEKPTIRDKREEERFVDSLLASMGLKFCPEYKQKRVAQAESNSQVSSGTTQIYFQMM